MIVVTGATGKLGHHVIAALLERVPADQVAVAVRHPDKAADLAARGLDVRAADYNHPETLESALAGADKVLLISANEIGERVRHHRTVIDAALRNRVALLAYTSILHADRSRLALAGEHLETERQIRSAGLPFVFLRNCWYFENYTENLAPALQHGLLVGCAGHGRIAAAARADYAAAAVEVLVGSGHEGRSYELAGDDPFTMSELAAEVSRQSGKSVAYQDLAPEQYKAVLVGAGLPQPVASMLVDADVGIRRGDLDDASGQLQQLIGRPTTPLGQAVEAGLRQLGVGHRDAGEPAPSPP